MRYRKRPIEIEAVQWTGNNDSEIRKFIPKGIAIYNYVPVSDYVSKIVRIRINTLEGVMEVSKGDYIIKGINRECYPCKEDIFIKTYDKIEEE